MRPLASKRGSRRLWYNGDGCSTSELSEIRAVSEQTISNELVAIGRFNSSVEASLAQNWLAEEGITSRLDGDATADWLNYYGSQLVGARLWVKQSDAERAQELLDQFEAMEHADEEAEEVDFPPTPPLLRAYRAAVYGGVWFPPLAIYSTFLVLRHRLWEPPPGEQKLSWRFYVTIVFQILGILVLVLGLTLWLRRVF